MIYQLGDRNVIFSSGNNCPGDVLQKRERGEWRFYKPSGDFVTSPVDLYQLPPGEYRLIPKESV